MLEHSPSTILTHTPKHSGNFYVFKTVSLEIAGKKINEYEYFDRPASKKLNASLDGISMIPLIKSSKFPQKKLVIVANFRPPINNYILEFPGGNVETESIEADAFRELKEETGFIGLKILDEFKSITCHYDAWKSKENGKLLVVEIDGDDVRNQNPEQELDKTEVIKVFQVDFNNNLAKNIRELSKRNGFEVSDQLYSFAMGISMSFSFDVIRS